MRNSIWMKGSVLGTLILLKPRAIIIGLLIFIFTNCASASQPTGERTSEWPGFNTGSAAYTAVIVIIIFVITTIAIVLLVKQAKQNKNITTDDYSQYPKDIQILKERYANGEITKEQFEQMKKDLEK